MEPGDRLSGPDWETAAAFLQGDAALGRDLAVIETHTARIHLSGDRAWKLRRPVNYGWLDYGTRARRRLCAEREIAWNSDTAPGLYLGLGGVGAGPCLLGPDTCVPATAEPLVVMRRFEDAALFDRMAEAGRLDAALMRRTGVAVAEMHRHRPVAPAAPPRLPEMATDEAAELGGLADIVGAARVDGLTADLRTAAARHGELAAGRGRRRCHGDLHLGNIVLWRGRPAPFDCIEFNEDFAVIDPLYDLAFLTMDLARCGLAPLRPAVLAAWAERMAACPDADLDCAYGGLALLPVYEALRAAIRAKTSALAARSGESAAVRTVAASAAAGYADLATGLLAPRPPPRVIAVGGRSGTGKTTLARALGARFGAIVLRSDAIRKGLAGVRETERLPSAEYAPERSAEVYAVMQARARMVLDAGMAVVLDAAHLSPGERAAAEALARGAGVPFDGLWLQTGLDTATARITARADDASDATPEVARAQAARDTGAIDWPVLATDRTQAAVLAAAVERLGAG